MDNQQQLESLVRDLNRKIPITWVSGMRLGKAAYDYLITRIQTNHLTRHQIANGLIALFRLRMRGNEGELFTLLRKLATHKEVRVRNQAVSLLIGMMKLHKLQSPTQLNTCIDEINGALTLGLNPQVTSLVRTSWHYMADSVVRAVVRVLFH